MNKQARENMLSVIQNFLANAPPQCDVEISVKYNLSNESFQQTRTFTTRPNAPPVSYDPERRNTTSLRVKGPGKRSSGLPAAPRSMTPVMVRKLRSEERVALKDAVPIFTPSKQSDSVSYEVFPAVKDNADEVNVSADPDNREERRKKTKAKSSTTDAETDDMLTSELFPVKKALRYNKKSGKYDKIS